MGRTLLHARATNVVIGGQRFHGNTKHRGTADASLRPVYTCWQHMLRRCENQRDKRYARYGGRGITVCERWRKDFAAFLADMGVRPSPAHTIDRIDNDGPYSPDNCRWATAAEQNRNTRRTRLITANGETLCVEDWAKRIGCSSSAIRVRLALGWSESRAVSERPSKSHRNRRLGKKQRRAA